MQGRCAICGRENLEVTKHHLVPKSQIRRISRRRKVSPFQLRNDIVWTCLACHGHIHSVLSEKELADSFYTLELLVSQEDVSKFVDWVSKRPAGRKIRHRRIRARM